MKGNNAPSSELPFHRKVYRNRPDIKAIIHAHPPALVAFSIVRQIPNLAMLPNDHIVVGDVGMAPYGIPGSEQLGEHIAEVFEQGYDAVILENHGVVVGGSSLFEAFQAFETLDFCSRLEIKAKRIGTPINVAPEFHRQPLEAPTLKTFESRICSTVERDLRQEMCKLVGRAYDQRLFTSTQGTFSQRTGCHSFIITPYNQDRKYLQPEDIVKVEDGRCEAGTVPSRSVLLHQKIYELQPHVHSILIAHPPGIMAFAVTDAEFDSRTIPESYILLRHILKLPNGATFRNIDQTARAFAADTPIVLVQNDCVIVTGQSLINAFDRLEVAEYSAKAVIAAKSLGSIVPIADGNIKEIDDAFHLPQR